MIERFAGSWLRPTPGFRAEDIHGKWSLRASVTSSLSLQDVHVPASNLLPKIRWPEVAVDVPESGALRNRLGSEWARPWPATTVRCNIRNSASSSTMSPSPRDQLVQEKLAWMISEITKAQLLVLQVGRLKDAGKSPAPAHLHGQAE